MRATSSILLLTFSIFIISSCHRSDRDKDNETQSTADYALADAFWNDIYKQMDDASAVTPDVNRYSNSEHIATCYSVNVNPAFPDTTFPKLVTLDFGTTNCTGPDGVNRRGIIQAVFTGKYRDSNTTITITTNNYFVNDYNITGTKTITNLGHINGVMTYSINVSNAVITSPANKTITWNSARTRRWIVGETTPLVVGDDVYEITGNASGRGTNGNSFTALITTPLRIQMNCYYIVSGVLKLSPANLADRIIDFGTGTCDDDATVSILGKSYAIKLH